MIKVVLENSYKSLLSNLKVDLPDFTIISGVNGAGKSHLLSAISQDVAKVFDENSIEMKPVKYVTSASLIPNDSYQVGRENLSGEINSILHSINNYIQTKKTNPSLTVETHFQHNLNHLKIIFKIIEVTNKEINELTIEDINDNFPLEYGLVSDVFYQNFSTIFKRYYDRYEDNFYFQWLNETKKKKKKFLSESKFFEKHGTPPWNFVNRIFEEADIGYSINDPIESDNRDLPFMFKLVNKTNGASVNFSDLSSGEKVLMSLTLSIYNAKKDIAFPKLLLLDEPDAPLHPSMAKQLLNVLIEVFVKEKGVKVIMTTHSPSTIAMAPDESLFVMHKENPRIQKQSKEQLMKLLTDGIPSFSIYSDNRRQVFVESSTDADFYTKVYGKVKNFIKSDKSLYFLSSGVTKNNTGNCSQVKEIVKVLSKNGCQTVYGIIDWDKCNNDNDKLYVLGKNQRYSIENYIFDPIIIAWIQVINATAV